MNPPAIDDSARALADALRMGGKEQSRRMRATRSIVAEFNTYRWVGEMMADAARLRTDPTGLHESHRTHCQPGMLHA
jgi:trehalose 6-phosphate synthase